MCTKAPLGVGVILVSPSCEGHGVLFGDLLCLYRSDVTALMLFLHESKAMC